MKYSNATYIETDETFGTYVCNICVKHMQHPDKIIATLKTLTAT
jgi:hypothetical protein